MFNICKKTLQWGGRTLTLETGRIARQADGAVLVTYGDTTVLVTVVAAVNDALTGDFVPLSVHYQEKYFAAGRIPGGYGRREGRASDKETLISRLIDRPLRPLFMHGYALDTQVVATVLSFDNENDADIAAIIGASAAVTLAGLPFMGPLAAAKVGFIDGAFVLNPTIAQVKTSALELVVAGTADAIMMIESEAAELSEAQMLEAVLFGHQQMQPVIDLIISMAEEAGKQPHPAPQPPEGDLSPRVQALIGDSVRAAYAIADKTPRRLALAQAQQLAIETLTAEGFAEIAIKSACKIAEKEVVRGDILAGKARIDGRDCVTIRPIVCETGVLARTHGSALFTRGETQALAVATLGTDDEAVMVDGLEGNSRERFMLHYNFPPYSVGEVGRLGAPGRREIGHGKLAWRALNPLMPKTSAQFPYSVRLVSEITESNGSSSMATVCAGSLALMDAGVPLPRPVAGIAMGLIKKGDAFVVLSDILGDEDHLGDMDFKVAGTSEGVTSLQMDIKIAGITPAIMQQALTQAHAGRQHILGCMAQALTQTRTAFSAYAPRIETIKIPPEKIREVIGSGGKVIREIVEYSGAKIDIADDGTVKISGTSSEAIDKARQRIEGITAEPEMNRIYEGKVVKVTDFGAFVNFMGARDGLVHVSQMAEQRVNHPSDIVSEGQVIRVRFVGLDDRGKIKLTMRGIE